MKDFGIKFVITLIAVAIAGIPTWFYLAVSSLLNPEGFWQKLVVMGVGLYFLGAIQFILGIFLLVFLFKIWIDD